jgi:hypothetical protein
MGCDDSKKGARHKAAQNASLAWTELRFKTTRCQLSSEIPSITIDSNISRAAKPASEEPAEGPINAAEILGKEDRAKLEEAVLKAREAAQKSRPSPPTPPAGAEDVRSSSPVSSNGGISPFFSGSDRCVESEEDLMSFSDDE